MVLFGHQLPVFEIEFRKEGVALDLGVDPGQIDPVDEVAGKGDAVDLRAAADEGLVVLGRELEGPLDRVHHLRTLRGKAPAPGHHHHRPARQRLADLVPGAAADDQVVPHGCALEMLEVSRQVPRQTAVTADDPVRRHGDNQ